MSITNKQTSANWVLKQRVCHFTKKKRKESLYAFCLTNVTRFMAYFFFFHPFSFKIKNLCILVMHEKINLNIKSVH